MGPSDDYVKAKCLTRHSRSIATVTGSFLLVGFALGTVAVAMSPQPILGGIAVLACIAGSVHRVLTKSRRDRMAALLGPDRAQLAEAKMVEVDGRTFAVDLVDTRGVSLRLQAPSAQAARDLVAIL